MKMRQYLFSCKMKNGRKDTRIGQGMNKREAARCILAMHKDVLKVLPTYIILRPEATW